jgi:lipoprotein-anchoring transpeptidase ErfK/SrfK
VSPFSRREFLKLGGLSLATLALPNRITAQSAALLGRVAYQSVGVFDAPKFDALHLSDQFRDALLPIEYALTPLTGPAYNPRWYKIASGYVHSALIQLVQDEPNIPLTSLPENGQVFRVTVPSTQPYNFSQQAGWTEESLFKLYYDSNHWVTAIVEGPNALPWYQITEPWEGVQYYAAARDLRPIEASEFEPISPDVPAGEKHIEISLAAQQLSAYERSNLVLRVPMSSGVQNSSGGGLPTQTPTGTFFIYSKLPTKYMGDSRLTDNLGDRFLTGVPWTCFFIEGGYAIHGAYWHNNFGAPMSKGCINLRPDHARWIYRWTSPHAGASQQEVTGHGTRVVVT